MVEQIEKQPGAAQFRVTIEAEYHDLLVGRRHFAKIHIHFLHSLDPIPSHDLPNHLTATATALRYVRRCLVE
jgi:hypothetical protein